MAAAATNANGASGPAAVSAPSDPRGLTRRAVLKGAGAALLLTPQPGLAAGLGSARPVFSRRVGVLAGRSLPLAAPRRFALVGVEWAGPGGARIELRVRTRTGAWSRWAAASVLGHDTDDARPRGRLFGEPVWIGAADYVELRSSRPVHGVRLHFVGTTPAAIAAAAGGPYQLAANAITVPGV